MCFRQLASCGISKWCLWQISQKSMSPATTLLTTYQPAMGCLVSSPGIYTMLIDEEMSIYARWSQREQDAPAAWKHCAVQRAPCQPLRSSPAPHHAPETAARHTRPCCIDCQRPGTKEKTYQCEDLALKSWNYPHCFCTFACAATATSDRGLQPIHTRSPLQVKLCCIDCLGEALAKCSTCRSSALRVTSGDAPIRACKSTSISCN